MAHIDRLSVRCASWDLSRAWVSDPKTGQLQARIYPQDKVKNAAGNRARRSGTDNHQPHDPKPIASPSPSPLLEKTLADYHATGLPPAYQPGPENQPPTENIKNTK